MRFIQTNESGEDGLTNRLAALVKKMKENEQLRQEYMAMNLHDYDMIRFGAQEKAVENAVMLVKKYKATPETAAQDAGAPLDKVLEALELQKELAAQTAN